MANQAKQIDPVVPVGKAPEELVLTAVANLARTLRKANCHAEVLQQTAPSKIGEEDDWEPGPEHCDDPLQLFRDAKACKRTILDLFSPEDRAELLKEI